jgi:hypothetical protein
LKKVPSKVDSYHYQQNHLRLVFYAPLFPSITATSYDIVYPSRVARFFLAQNTKTGENIPNSQNNCPISIKNAKLPPKIQLAIKYANLFHFKALQNLPKLGFLD